MNEAANSGGLVPEREDHKPRDDKTDADRKDRAYYFANFSRRIVAIGTSKLGQLKNQIRTRGLELGHHQGLDKLKQMISKYEEILKLTQ